ncbi:hypothetical protein L1076_18675 [Vibrio sp. MMG022]|uniref:hypothetical protein n=1 Tax=Vibrio sp. MMG023 TaxID=2909979 RepID=UPI001F223424|nr:hypothetical protein [Vibrio sp. MMG023]MCF6453604.1 hypothetical protein [Vibrio sp. MMG023]
MSRLLVKWASGKFSLWKASVLIAILLILSPWLSLLGSKFSIESQLNNPSRKLNLYVNNGLFTFITTLEDGTTRKSSGILGYTNRCFYFLTLSSQYLYITSHSSQAFKRDLINANNRYFDARIERLNKQEFLLTYDEEIESEGKQKQKARLHGDLTWLR